MRDAKGYTYIHFRKTVKDVVLLFLVCTLDRLDRFCGSGIVELPHVVLSSPSTLSPEERFELHSLLPARPYQSVRTEPQFVSASLYCGGVGIEP